MPKPILKSVRMSEEVFEFVDTFKLKSPNYKSEGFNQQFENIVLYFKNELPKQRKKLDIIEKKIAEREKYLTELSNKIQVSESFIYTINSYQTQCEQAFKAMKKYVDVK